jgi:4a-hydroxytetrahydrobiopterin dehydratase
MDMLRGEQIAAARLADWRKLAQGLHARYLVDGFGAAARFVAAVGELGDAVAHHPRVSIGPGYVDLKLSSDDAIYRDDDGTEYVVEWVTQQDIDLARRITQVASDQRLAADPAAVSVVELGLDAADSGAIAPMWAMLLTGDPAAQGRGTPSDEVRDALGRVPNLWFADLTDIEAHADANPEGTEARDVPRAVQQRVHIEVYVAPEVAGQRLAAALAAGGTVADDSQAPGLVVIADPEGNRGVLCHDTSRPPQD